MDKTHIKQVIASVLETQLGINPEQVMAGVPFIVLEKNFDSLMFLETQMLIEEKLNVQFDEEFGKDLGKTPQNADELAEAIVQHLATIS